MSKKEEKIVKRKQTHLGKKLNSQLNGMAERHQFFDAHLEAINIQMLCLSWTMVFLLWIYNDACYDLTTLVFSDSFQDCEIAYWLKCVAWIVNLLFLWRLCMYYRFKSWASQSQWGFQSKFQAFTTTSLWKQFLVELFIAIIYPLPTTADFGFLNNWLSLFCFFRCYLILRAFRDVSPMWKNRDAIERHFRRQGHTRETITFKSVWVVYYHQYTILCVAGVFFFTVVFFSYNMWLAEREFWNQGVVPPDPYKVSQYDGKFPQEVFPEEEWVQTEYKRIGVCTWNIVVTMTTVGYGYIRPLYWQGRVYASIAVLLGIIQTSMIVGVLTDKLKPTKFQAMIMSWIQRDKWTQEQRNAAAKVIQNCWRERIRWSTRARAKFTNNGKEIPRRYLARHIRTSLRPLLRQLKHATTKLAEIQAVWDENEREERADFKLISSVAKLGVRADKFLRVMGLENEPVTRARMGTMATSLIHMPSYESST